VQAKNDAGLQRNFRSRLIALQNARYMKIPRANATPSVPDGAPEGTEPQFQPEDFEDVLDPASPFIQSGLTEDEIDQMIGALP
jgi:hypothetical protein